MRAAFQRTARRNAELLNALASTGVDLVGIDPSMTLTYRSEYRAALGDMAPKVSLPQEWLSERLAELPDVTVTDGVEWLLLPHCTERTNAPSATADWVRVARRLGVNMQVVASGCCGMAGLYGHELANRHVSETIYAQSWQAILRDVSKQGRVLASGFSCRCQALIIDAATLPHPVQVLLHTLKARSQTTHVPQSAPVKALACRGAIA
jgi:Fe-S oxidoreductase